MSAPTLGPTPNAARNYRITATSRRALLAVLAVAVLTAGVPGALGALDASATGLTASAVTPTAPGVDRTSGSLTAAAAQRFLDEELPRYVERFDVPGATASIVVPEGEVLTSAAGTADASTGRALTADTPLRVASISKSFTAVAVLQLIDQGAFTFDTPVEQVLPSDVVLDHHDGWRAVTIRDLLTHTAGFEERLAGTTTEPGAPAADLHTYLRDARSRMIYPPGTVVSYSNYGYALLGLVVQTASATPFTQRLDGGVFGPLGMSHTTFTSSDDVSGLAMAHRRGEAGPEPAPAVGMAEFPAGGAISTAQDMGRFMGWLLAENHTPVLSQASALGMLTRHAGAHPELPGSGWGTWERFVPGVRTTVIGHDGDLTGTHSAYVVLPGEGVGLFLSVDGDPVDAVHDLRRALIADFVRRATPTEPAAEPTGASAAGSAATLSAVPAGNTEVSPAAQQRRQERVQDVAGTYVTSRRSVSDASALKVALDQMRVTTTAGGGLRSDNPALGTTSWAPLGPDVFVSTDGERLALLRDPRGQVKGVATSLVPTQTYLRVDTLHDPILHLAVAAGGAVLALLGAFRAGIAPGVRLRGRRRFPDRGSRVGRGARTADGLAIVAGVSVVVALGALAAAAAAPEGIEDVIARQSLLLSLPFTIAGAFGAAAVVAAVFVAGGGRSRHVSNLLGGLGSLVACVVAVGYHLTLLQLQS